MADLPSYASFDVWSKIWPPADRKRAIAPVRVGIDRHSGKMLVGFDHVLQSMEVLFETRYHERELREWVGSLIPHLLGQNITVPTITNFFWAFATALELFEPCYRVERVRVSNVGQKGATADLIREPTTAESIRKGAVTFRFDGVYMPRGHLGDKTPERQRAFYLAGTEINVWRAREIS